MDIGIHPHLQADFQPSIAVLVSKEIISILFMH